MGPISFFMRVLAVTVVAVLFMQIRVGQSTIEDHAIAFITHSSLVEPIDETATNITRMVRNGLARISKAVSSNFKKSKYGSEGEASSWWFKFPVVDNTSKKQNEEDEDVEKPPRRRPTSEVESSEKKVKSENLEPLKTGSEIKKQRSEDTRSVLERFKESALRAKEKLQAHWQSPEEKNENQGRAFGSNKVLAEPHRARAVDPESEELLESEEE